MTVRVIRLLAPADQKLIDQYYQRDNQHNMYQVPADVGKKAKQPQDNQNAYDGPDHICLLSDSGLQESSILETVVILGLSRWSIGCYISSCGARAIKTLINCTMPNAIIK